MSKKTRRQYTAEFKQEAVKLVTEQGYGVAEAARNLDINANVLRRWKQELADEQAGNRLPPDEREELRRLREENRRLKMEREILKNRPRSAAPHRIETQVPLHYWRAWTMAVCLLVNLTRQKTWSGRICGPNIGGTW